MLKKLNILFAVLIMFNIAQLKAQTIMKIHQSNGILIQLPLSAIDSITYSTGPLDSLPVVTTDPITDISGSSVVSGVNLINFGGSATSQSGLCWSTSPHPTTADNYTTSPFSYIATVLGLINNTTYYIRAYAINSSGTGYGNELTFTTGDAVITNPGVGVSFNGYTYQTAIIGNGQEWMTENLRSALYANGDSIPYITDENEWSNLTTGAQGCFLSNSYWENPYGKYYNGYAIADARNVCPTGWHVPSELDWDSLTNYLGGTYVAGGKMKSTDSLYWGSSATLLGNNESGLSFLPSGYRSNLGYDDGLGSYGDYWSSTEVTPTSITWLTVTSSYWSADILNNGVKKYGMSVRCVKD